MEAASEPPLPIFIQENSQPREISPVPMSAAAVNRKRKKMYGGTILGAEVMLKGARACY